jgi:hypothetical protein
MELFDSLGCEPMEPLCMCLFANLKKETAVNLGDRIG